MYLHMIKYVQCADLPLEERKFYLPGSIVVPWGGVGVRVFEEGV